MVTTQNKNWMLKRVKYSDKKKLFFKCGWILSHSSRMIDLVSYTCLSASGCLGLIYIITSLFMGYTREGPHLLTNTIAALNRNLH